MIELSLLLKEIPLKSFKNSYLGREFPPPLFWEFIMSKEFSGGVRIHVFGEMKESLSVAVQK